MKKYRTYFKKIRQNIELTLDFAEMFDQTVEFLKKHPEVAEKIFKNLDKKYPYDIKCPFPGQCNKFPCETLSCGADTINNGYCYRMS